MPLIRPGLRLHRVGLRPDPLAWSPWEWVGAGRYDDPARVFRVLYAAESRFTCLKEVLIAQRRRETNDSKLAAALASLDDPEASISRAAEQRRHQITRAWRLTRAFGELELAAGQTYLNLRETGDLLEVEAALGAELGIEEISLEHIASVRHEKTQRIARWAFETGYRAILYPSRIGADDRCWAIFDNAVFTPLGLSHIAHDDPDLQRVAQLYHLDIEVDEPGQPT